MMAKTTTTMMMMMTMTTTIMTMIMTIVVMMMAPSTRMMMTTMIMMTMMMMTMMLTMTTMMKHNDNRSDDDDTIDKDVDDDDVSVSLKEGGIKVAFDKVPDAMVGQDVVITSRVRNTSSVDRQVEAKLTVSIKPYWNGPADGRQLAKKEYPATTVGAGRGECTLMWDVSVVSAQP